MPSKKATAKIVVDDNEVILTVEGVTLKFNGFLAKEIGEKLFKAGCLLRENEKTK